MLILQKRKISRRIFTIGGGVGFFGACSAPIYRTISDESVSRNYPPIGVIEKFDGLDVHSIDSRSKGAVVVLIHGANVNLRDWTFSTYQELSERNRVIAIDRPGFGYSERDQSYWPPEKQAAQLREVIKKKKIKKYILIGHSWGALVALSWAQKFPNEVMGVVSISGATMPFGVPGKLFNELGLLEIAFDHYYSFVSRNVENGIIEKTARKYFSPQKVPNGYLDYVGIDMARREKTLEAIKADLLLYQKEVAKMSKLYKNIQLPVEILHGEKDKILNPGKHAIKFATKLPNSRLEILKDVGHMAHHGRTDKLLNAIARLKKTAR